MEGATLEFRLFDDDKIFYCEGLAQDQDAAEEAHNYVADNYGATYSEIREIGSERWDAFIS
jgi:hypothetical protein